MADIATRSRLLHAPADRPAGRRGARGGLAAAAALGAVLPLSLSRFTDDPSWAGPGLAAFGLALLGGALLLWTARRPATLGAAVALVVLGVAGTVAAMGAANHAESEAEKWGGFVMSDNLRSPPVSRAEAEAVPKGLTREQVTRRLGRPPGHGIQRVTGEPDLRCLVYRSPRSTPNRLALHAFCFRDGRYAELREW